MGYSKIHATITAAPPALRAPPQVRTSTTARAPSPRRAPRSRRNTSALSARHARRGRASSLATAASLTTDALIAAREEPEEPHVVLPIRQLCGEPRALLRRLATNGQPVLAILDSTDCRAGHEHRTEERRRHAFESSHRSGQAFPRHRARNLLRAAMCPPLASQYRNAANAMPLPAAPINSPTTNDPKIIIGRVLSATRGRPVPNPPSHPEPCASCPSRRTQSTDR